MKDSCSRKRQPGGFGPKSGSPAFRKSEPGRAPRCRRRPRRPRRPGRRARRPSGPPAEVPGQVAGASRRRRQRRRCRAQQELLDDVRAGPAACLLRRPGPGTTSRSTPREASVAMRCSCFPGARGTPMRKTEGRIPDEPLHGAAHEDAHEPSIHGTEVDERRRHSRPGSQPGSRAWPRRAALGGRPAHASGRCLARPAMSSESPAATASSRVAPQVAGWHVPPRSTRCACSKGSTTDLEDRLLLPFPAAQHTHSARQRDRGRCAAREHDEQKDDKHAPDHGRYRIPRRYMFRKSVAGRPVARRHPRAAKGSLEAWGPQGARGSTGGFSGSTSTDHGAPGSPPSSATGSSPRRTTWKRQRPPRRATYAGTGPRTATRRPSSTARRRRRSASSVAVRSAAFPSRKCHGQEYRTARRGALRMRGHVPPPGTRSARPVAR